MSLFYLISSSADQGLQNEKRFFITQLASFKPAPQLLSNMYTWL